MDAKTRDRVEFDNKAIESFESEFSFNDKSEQVKWRKHKYTPFKVAKNSCLKGLKLFQTRKSKDKFFVVQYWLNGKANYWTIGKYGPEFGTKEVEQKLFKISEDHKDKKGNWIRDPRITEAENNRTVAVADYQQSLKKTLNELIIEYVKAGYPRARQDGLLDPISREHFNRYAFGFSERIRHIKHVTINNNHTIRFIDNKRTRMKAPNSFDQLFDRYPPGKYLFKKKFLNPHNYTSIFDSNLGKTLLDDLNSGTIKRFVAPYSYGVKRHIITCFKFIWAFGLDQGYLGDKATHQDNPTKFILKKPRITKSKQSQYNKGIFKDGELEIIWDTLVNLRSIYPFQAECLMLMMLTSIREEEIRRIEWSFIDEKYGWINLPGTITKSGKNRKVKITEPVKEVLNYLKEYRNKTGFEWSNFVKWIFPTPRFKYIDWKNNKLPPEYINSSETKLKQVRECWRRVRELTGINGVPKMFRKTYSTKAKDILGQTGLATRLTGHEQDSTLDRFYYGADETQIEKDANKVAEVFTFKKKA